MKYLAILVTILPVFASAQYDEPGDYTIGGKVGIGTTNPEVDLHVHENNVGVKSTYSNVVLEATDSQMDLISSSDGTWGSSINLIEGNGASNADIWSIVRQTTNGVGNSSLRFNFGPNNLHTNDNIMTLLKDGKVGIGTSSPDATLHLIDSEVGQEVLMKLQVSGATSDYFRIANATSSSSQFIPSISAYHVSDNRQALFLSGKIEQANDQGTIPVVTFDSRISDSAISNRPLFGWDSYGNRKMTLNADGSLGIGTIDTGTHGLAVHGSIGAREIVVEASGWSDHVFNEDYSLMDLKLLEEYVKKNRHLPGIPSEDEVMEDGISIGDMNARLLEKIEELTLYVIAQEKRIEEQGKRLEAESLKVKVLEERMKEQEAKREGARNKEKVERGQD